MHNLLTIILYQSSPNFTTMLVYVWNNFFDQFNKPCIKNNTNKLLLGRFALSEFLLGLHWYYVHINMFWNEIATVMLHQCYIQSLVYNFYSETKAISIRDIVFLRIYVFPIFEYSTACINHGHRMIDYSLIILTIKVGWK